MTSRKLDFIEAAGAIYLILFGIPGLLVGAAAMYGVAKAGWTSLALPAWAIGVFAVGIWLSVSGLVCVHRGAKLPAGWRIAKSDRPVPWTLIAPALMTPSLVVVLGSSDAVNGGGLDFPIGRAIRDSLPLFGWAFFTVLPVLVGWMVAKVVLKHLHRPAGRSSGEVPGPSGRIHATEGVATPVPRLHVDESMEQRFARQRAEREALKRADRSER